MFSIKKPMEISITIRQQPLTNLVMNNILFFTLVSPVMIVDEEVEDLEEEDLDCEGEMDPESPPWDIYGEEDIDCEGSDDPDEHENTALLRASAAKTEIIITPMSPVIYIFREESFGWTENK